MKTSAIIMLLAALALAGCLTKSETNGNSSHANAPANVNARPANAATAGKTAETKEESAAANVARPQSNRLDACAVLPKEEIEKIVGEAVDSAALGRVTEGTAETAAFSQCPYRTAGGQTIEFFARRSPVADNTPEAIERTRATVKDVTKKEPQEITALGRAAFWVPVVNQLHAFGGDDVYVYVTMARAKSEPQAKAHAIQLASRALANLNQ